MEAEEGTAPARERGWLGPIAALLVMVMATSMPTSRIVVPVGDVLLLLAPVTAACAMAGLRAGGRLPLAVIWTAFAVWVLVRTPVAGAHTDLVRGWAVLLALAFGVASARGIGETFLPRALAALVAAAAVGVVAILVVPGGAAGAWETVTAEIGRRAEAALRAWTDTTGSPEWAELAASSPFWGTVDQTMQTQLAALPRMARRFFPALIALQSLATLALGWAVYHRVGRARLGPPLADLKDLRFHDALVWGVVAGLGLVALPFTGIWRDLGVNLLMAFGALYALRGMGVVLWFLSPGRAMTVVLLVFTVFFWPVVVTVSAGLGLGDTWFDWRRASRPQSQRSE